MKEAINKYLIFTDGGPDELGRRTFFLEWDDFHACKPNCTPNPDGSYHCGQIFFAKPEKYIEQGWIIKERNK